MALNFYLNSISSSNKINVQTNASFTSKIGDFDVGTLTLEWNTTKNKIAPFTKLYIEDTTNEDYWCFIVLSDEVEVVKKTPTVIYAHNLTVTQNTYQMTSQMVRNSVFTQPIAPKTSRIRAMGETSVNVVATTSGSTVTRDFSQNNNIYVASLGGSPNYSHTRTFLSSREKIKRIVLNVKTMTYSFANVSYLATPMFSLSSPRDVEINAFTSITLIISRYSSSSSTSALATETIEVTDGEDVIELDDDFFVGGYWYEATISTTSLPQLETLDSYTFTDVSNEFTSGTYVVPAIITHFEIDLVIETYYYSLLDIIRILRNEVSKTYNGSTTKTNLFTMPSSGTKYETLVNTIAPDFTFTEENLWNCVADVLKYIDAIPTMDENDVLSFEYLNDYSRDATSFSKVDDKSILANDYYTNSLVANYQDAHQPHAIYYPGKNLFKRVSSTVYGIPTTDDYEFRTDQPIYYIDDCWVLFDDSQTYHYQVYFNVSESLYNGTNYILFENKFYGNALNIRDVLYEKSLYALLSMGDEDSDDANQLNSLYYTKGSKSIYIGGIDTDGTGVKYTVYKKALVRALKEMTGIFGTFGSTSSNDNGVVFNALPSIYNLQYCVHYHAIFEGRASEESTINKYEGETSATQENGSTDLNRMGNNMQGLIAKLGNEVDSFILPVTSYGSRIKKGSLWVDDDGNKYIANLVKTTFSTSSDKVMVEAQFSRNFNLLSQFSRINQQKRFYEIDENIVNTGYENIHEYLYFSTTQRTITSVSQETAMSTLCVRALTGENFTTAYDSSSNKADFATMNAYDLDTTSASASNIYIPLHVYGFGNSICFEMGFDSAINAADRILNTTNASGTSILKNETTLYTGSDGFANILDFTIRSYRDSDGIYLTQNFPDITNAINNYTFYELINIEHLYYFKKPNEIVHLNYSVAFMPYPGEEIFFGDAFINNNTIIRKDNEINPTKTFYLYAGTTLYSIIDNKVLSDHTNYGQVSIDYTTSTSGNYMRGYIGITIPNYIPSGTKAWALADADGNIYIAVNETISSATNTRHVYVYPRRWRIDS